MKVGYSQIRNRALAHAFSYMNLIEAWGSGIPKLMEAMRDYGLREPEFCDLEIGFRINLYRKLENEQKEATQGSSQIIQNTTQGTTQVTQNTTQDTTQVELHIEKLSTEDKQVLEIVK